MPTSIKSRMYYLSMDANGCTYVSKRPMSEKDYGDPIAKLKCIPTRAKKITRKGVFPGAICVTIKNEILKIVSVENINGWKREWIKEGTI